MMRRRLKRTSQRYIVISLASITIICATLLLVYFTIFKQMKENYQNDLNVLKEQLEAKEVYIYEAKVDIPAGCQINEKDLSYSLSYSDKPQSYFMTKKDIGMTALIDINAGTQIIEGMLSTNTIDSNLREVEYNTFYINSNIIQNDYIDVRIRFPNGEDYIVLSKKRILAPNLESFHCFLWLKEEEIINMSSAIVDAYLYSGSLIYTTKYIEPNLQQESIPTYQPSLASIELMELDKNIVDKASKEVNKRLRKAMENRLTEYMNLDISEINWNLSKETVEEVSESESLEQGIKTQGTKAQGTKAQGTKDQSNEQNQYYITDSYEVQEDEEIIYGG